MTEPEGALLATVDRIERDQDGRRLAVLVFDDGQQLVVPVERLPRRARVGSVLRVAFQPDPESERQRREEITRLQEKLFGPEE